MYHVKLPASAIMKNLTRVIRFSPSSSASCSVLPMPELDFFLFYYWFLFFFFYCSLLDTVITGKGKSVRECLATTYAPAPPRTSSTTPPTHNPIPVTPVFTLLTGIRSDNEFISKKYIFITLRHFVEQKNKVTRAYIQSGQYHSTVYIVVSNIY